MVETISKLQKSNIRTVSFNKRGQKFKNKEKIKRSMLIKLNYFKEGTKKEF